MSPGFTRLSQRDYHTPQLFRDGDDVGDDVAAGTGGDTEKHQRLDAALDKLRARYGRKVIYYGRVQESRDEAPMRIAFTHIPDAGLEGGLRGE